MKHVIHSVSSLTIQLNQVSILKICILRCLIYTSTVNLIRILFLPPSVNLHMAQFHFDHHSSGQLAQDVDENDLSKELKSVSLMDPVSTEDTDDQSSIAVEKEVMKTSLSSQPDVNKAIACCEAAIRGVNSMHPPDLCDRIKNAAILSLLARCYLTTKDRALCEQTSLKLALFQVSSST